jgi:hypothetical protein
VALPRFARGLVAEATPEVDGLTAGVIDRNRGTGLPTAVQVATKRVGDFSITLVDVTADEFRRDLQFCSHVSAILIALLAIPLIEDYAADLLWAAHQLPCRRWQSAMPSGCPVL